MRYLRLCSALLLAALLASCNTTKKLYEAKEYDQVIQRLAPDICYGDMNANRINMVALSYHKANQADHERIQALKATGQPDVWPEIYQRYCSMKGRNEALKCFPTKIKNAINYKKLDLDDELVAARNKAENFLVAKATQLLGTGSKTDAMDAETYLIQLARTNRENPNLLGLKKKQAFAVADEVSIGIENESKTPDYLKQVIYDFDEGEVPYEMVHAKASNAMVTVSIDDIEISPIRHDEVTFKETYGGKTATVTDHTQTKSATLKGTVSYRNADGKRLGVAPFEVKSTFKNEYTTVAGDRDACSEETISRLGGASMPVPVDESLILDAGKKLNDVIGQELRK